MEKGEKEKIRQRNCKGEYIYRSGGDYFYPIAAPAYTPKIFSVAREVL